MCDLLTIGRVTGEVRTAELWFGAVGATLYFLSGGGDHANWVRNIDSRPDVHVRLGGRRYAGRGRRVTAPEEERVARELLAAKYQGWREGRPLSRWARESLPVAVDLVQEGGR